MSHQNNKADIDSIELNGYRFILEGAIDESLINIHGRKVSQGEPGPDDHPTNSTWIQSDWSSGGQVHDGHPDVVNGRFDFAKAETMQAHTISLPPYVNTWDDPGASGNECVALGVYEDAEWASWGADVRKFNSGTEAWDNLGSNLTAAPVTKGKVFTASTGSLVGDPVFCIPLDSSFDYINGTTITNVAKKAIDFCVMDNKLFRLGADGSFEYTSDLSSWSGLCYIPDDSTPRHLNVYMTLGGEPSIHATTSGGVFAWDPLSGSFYPTELQYPKHPDQGRGSAVWRADLYTSVADGVHRYNRSTITAQGLDRDDGLPYEYKGVIVDLEPSYNALYALLSGEEVTAAQVDDPYYLHAGDDYMTASTGSVYSTLMKWNGFGWHYVYSTTGTAPTTVFVSDANEQYGVWFAANKKMHRIKLTRPYMNLKDDVSYRVADSGFFETAWYDYGWEGQTKVVKLLEVYTEQCTDDETVEVLYKIDHETAPWISMGTITDDGEHAFYFGRDSDASPTSTDPDDYHGEGVDRIKLRFNLSRGSDNTKKPLIKWFALSARKMLRPVRTFRLVLSLDKTNDYTAQQLREVLINMLRTARSYNFVYQNETLKVDIVALELKTVGSNSDIFHVAKINLIEANETIF